MPTFSTVSAITITLDPGLKTARRLNWRPVRAQDRKQRHGVANRLVLDPSEVPENGDGRCRPSAVAAGIETGMGSACNRWVDDSRQFFQVCRDRSWSAHPAFR
jgi:hypothetical protein